MKKSCILALFASLSINLLSEVVPVKHRQVIGDDLVYKAEQIDVLLQDAGKVKKIIAGQNVTVSPTTGEGEVTINASGGSKHIAMFIIPMNESPSTSVSTSYQHFELKASYNNFSSEYSDANRCCYYVHSGHADIAGILQNDKARLFIEHSGENSTMNDQRSYVKVSNTIEDSKVLNYAPNVYVVLVDATQCWSQRSDGSWLNSEDPNLIWTYVRTKNSSRETDPGTDHALWRPIAPVKWLTEIPRWAQQ